MEYMMAPQAESTDPEHTPETLMAAGERLFNEGRRLLNSLEVAARFSSGLRPDGTCPIFFHDEVFHVALPFADIDQLQMKLLARHAPIDELLLHQIIDLVPTLKGRVFLDVGSFTGTFALIIRQFLNPKATHLFEPQKTMREALESTIAINEIAKDTTLHDVVIDDGTSPIEMGRYRPEKLSMVNYLRRASGSKNSKSIDALKLKPVGFINLDYNNPKIDALNGASKTIERDRPVVVCDLTGRDIAEQKAYFEERSYQCVRAGENHVIFLPE